MERKNWNIYIKLEISQFRKYKYRKEIVPIESWDLLQELF